MRTVQINVHAGQPLLDIASYARRGPVRRDQLSPTELALISRTAHRVPEVVVKVLTRGAASLGAVAKHLGYIGRYGDLAVETDDGVRLQGRGIGRELVEHWDLDLDEHRRKPDLNATFGRKPARLVHKLMFSMPPGTPPAAVLAATRNFLREEFALSHRYAFVLHTDEPHPHVHAVVKAVSEQGVRLHVKKDVLRRWRGEFARHLRDQGVEANATERAVRGQSKATQRDAIFRAAQRGDSSYMRNRLDDVMRSIARGEQVAQQGKTKMFETHAKVLDGWRAVHAILEGGRHTELAFAVQRFIQQIPPPTTLNELLASELLHRVRKSPELTKSHVR